LSDFSAWSSQHLLFRVKCQRVEGFCGARAIERVKEVWAPSALVRITRDKVMLPSSSSPTRSHRAVSLSRVGANPLAMSSSLALSRNERHEAPAGGESAAASAVAIKDAFTHE
jgi:hypothetical protein